MTFNFLEKLAGINFFCAGTGGMPQIQFALNVKRTLPMDTVVGQQ